VRLVLLVTSPRVAPGALTWEAWQVLREGVVFTRDQDHPQRPALAAAGVVTEAVDPEHPPVAIARILRGAAEQRGTAVWLAGPGGDDDIGRALADMALGHGQLGHGQVHHGEVGGEAFEIEVVHGNWDLPGSRLLDVVTTMDRLRSPGGCPWDAQQTHDSLAPYLLEEAYEAFQAIEDEDHASLREELGDVLLQVAFHARLAEERDEHERWSIDDVAAGLVDKLVRRHPHVFGDVSVGGADEVVANWDTIKAQEKGRASAVEGVAMSSPALTLAATLQRKAAKLGVPVDLVAPEVAAAQSAAVALSALVAAYEDEPGPDTAGALLWSLVVALRSHDVDAEAALRARARAFRDRVASVERDVHESHADVSSLDHTEWRQRWDAE
jgi:XTP/dITP diphosphohydrolase